MALRQSLALARKPVHHFARSYSKFTNNLENYSFSNHRVLITGGSRGIGKAIASAFVSRGAYCVLIGRDSSRLNQALKDVQDLNLEANEKRNMQGESNAVFAMDVSDFSNWESLLDKSNTKFHSLTPKVDILINAAGISSSSLFTRTEPQVLEDIVRINLLGTMWACRYIGKELIKNKKKPGGPIEKGVIINIGSLLGQHRGRGVAAYAASKAGIIGLTRALAAEFGPLGVRVNAIVPGYVETDMTKFLLEQKNTSSGIASLSRFASPEEIAHAALFLATNQYANNCIVNLDGGLSAE